MTVIRLLGFDVFSSALASILFLPTHYRIIAPNLSRKRYFLVTSVLYEKVPGKVKRDCDCMHSTILDKILVFAFLLILRNAADRILY
jgi:hypothetical protein